MSKFIETEEFDLFCGVPPLTDEERQWCQDLADLISRIPPRLEIMTGESTLHVFDSSPDIDTWDKGTDCLGYMNLREDNNE